MVAPAVPTLPPERWLGADDRVAILAHGAWTTFGAKTGIQVLRFGAAQVVGVVDPTRAGSEAAAPVGVPEKAPVPVVAGLNALLGPQAPTRVVIGVAPVGGQLPTAMRADIALALRRGIPVICGLHAFLAEDEEFGALSRAHGTPIVDLRRPPPDPVILSGAGRSIPVPVVLTVGTDCSAGKMTVAVALRAAARERGLRAAFVATGQTGLLMAPESGAPIDRCMSDFAAGEVERQTLRAARLGPDGRATADTPDVILVEGQAALSHPAYSGVTLSLLHGSFPDALLLCHVVGRPNKRIDVPGAAFPVLPLSSEIALNEALAAPLTRCKVAAIGLATPGLDDVAYRRACEAATRETGLPAFDVLRGGAGPMLDALLDHLARRPGKMVSRLASRKEAA